MAVGSWDEINVTRRHSRRVILTAIWLNVARSQARTPTMPSKRLFRSFSLRTLLIVVAAAAAVITLHCSLPLPSPFPYVPFYAVSLVLAAGAWGQVLTFNFFFRRAPCGACIVRPAS